MDGEHEKLIELDAALDIVCFECGEFQGISGRIIKKLEALPSAQKKGHWIDEGTNYSCSECHRGCWVNSNYCPWCGARNSCIGKTLPHILGGDLKGEKVETK